MRRAVSFERPNFHLTEPLSAELRFTAEWLLRNQRVWSDRAGVNLIVHKVRKFEHIDVTDGYFLLELLARQAVVKTRFARWSDRRRNTEFVKAIVRHTDVL